MPTYRIIKLKFDAPIHLGAGRDEYDQSFASLHSDTLSAALAAVKASRGETDDLKAFLQSFRISSAFPYSGDTLFLPKPASLLNVAVNGREEKDVRKQLKRIVYVEKCLWETLATGQKATVNPESIQKDYLVVDGKSFSVPFKKQLNQRVAVSRDGQSDADPFYFEWLFFRPEAGLYCLVDADDTVFDELCSLFRELGENGIGTDRSVGGGQFTITPGTISMPENEAAEQIMLLSLYLPNEDELAALPLDRSQYGLTLRGGYMAGSTQLAYRHLRKKTVNMFVEGSLFPRPARPLEGQVIDLRPDWNDGSMHPVWRSGIPFYLPVKTSCHE